LKYFLIYDDHCKVCEKFARLVKKYSDDSLLQVISPTDLEAEPLYQWVSPAAMGRDLHLMAEDGSVILKGEEAAQKVVDFVPALKRVDGIPGVDLKKFGARGFYRFLNGIRNKFCPSCGNSRREKRLRRKLGED